MRGHVRKRGKRWAVVYDEGRNEEGRRVQRWRSGFRTKGEAENFLSKTVSSLGDGSYVAPSKLTFGAYLENWLEEIADTVKPSTSKRYREVAKRHLIPRRGRVPLQGLKRGHLTTLYRDLREAGLAPATVAMTHAVVHPALKDAVASDLIVRNVASTVKGPRPGVSKARAWSARELASFLECVAADRLFAFWRLAATTGMRRGELLGPLLASGRPRSGKARRRAATLPRARRGDVRTAEDEALTANGRA